MYDRIEFAHDVVAVSHHQLQVVDLNVIGPSGQFSWSENGLVFVERGIAAIACGVHTGSVAVDVELHVEQPNLSIENWDDVVDVSIESIHGQLRVVGLMSDLPQQLPPLSRSGAGWYRLRIHVRGRDYAAFPGNFSDGQFEDEAFFIQSWPSLEEPIVVRKQSDAYGAELRGSN